MLVASSKYAYKVGILVFYKQNNEYYLNSIQYSCQTTALKALDNKLLLYEKEERMKWMIE